RSGRTSSGGRTSRGHAGGGASMQRSSFRVFSLILLTAIAAWLAGGINSADPLGRRPTASAGARMGRKLKLAFVTNKRSDFWRIVRAGCKKAQQEMPNVDVNFQIPSDGTAATQRRIVDDLLARGIDGIAISPVDPANETDMLNQVAKKTLLITQDSD